MSRSIPIMELPREPYERGRYHGKTLREFIHAHLSWKKHLYRSLGNDTTRLSTEVLYDLHDALNDAHKPLVRELEGISDGATVSYEDVLFLNFFSEIIPTEHDGCTSFVATSKPDAPKWSLMAKNRDLMHFADFPLQTCYRLQSDTGKVFLASSLAGMIGGGIGFNEEGVAGLINAVGRSLDAQGKPGIQRSIALRLLLETCHNTHEAVAGLTSIRLAFQAGIFIFLDIHGNYAVVEKTQNHQDVIYGYEGAIARTNHVQAEDLIPHVEASKNPTLDESSRNRYHRIMQLLAAVNDTITVEHAKTFLRDHANGLNPQSICTHSSYGPNTASAYIIDMIRSKIYIANGHPCDSEFIENQL